MSVEEDSFIVLDETPSMLQFSMLDSPVCNSTDIDDKISTIQENDIVEIEANNTNGCTTKKSTLAQSFLLGDINSDKLKSYFRSRSNSGNTADIEQWQNLVQESNELKDALQYTNATMRQQHTMVNVWHSNVNDLKEHHEQELKNFRNINDELFQQNHELHGKVAELQQLAELSRETHVEREKERLNAMSSEKEQRERQIENLRSELATAIGANVELEENIKQYEKLKLDYIELDKICKESTSEIASLKTQNEKLRQDLEKTTALVTEFRENAHVNRAQCEVFRHDFELERKQREEMVSEREQLISEIKMLQKRNQALIDEAQSYYTETSAVSLTSITTNAFSCPLCEAVYDDVNNLESHVQSCLEKNGK